MKVDGSCHCRRITYQATVDPENVSICHCTDCQMLTGSVYWVSVPAPKASFSLLTGKPKVYIKDYGAPVYPSAIDDPPTYSLRVGCLRRRANLPPRKRI